MIQFTVSHQQFRKLTILLRPRLVLRRLKYPNDPTRLLLSSSPEPSRCYFDAGWVSPALLATVRVAQLTADERPLAENVSLQATKIVPLQVPPSLSEPASQFIPRVRAC